MEFDRFKVGYFSMEIGIDPTIPTYSGGLGVLAGDTLRSCADLEVPVIAVSLLYKKGYFKQIIENGQQKEVEEAWDIEKLDKLSPKVKVRINDHEIEICAWLYKLKGHTGNVNPVIFLDTDLESNSEHDRTITQRLYGKDDRYRLLQEIVLGIGGVRMLKALGCQDIIKYHMNEGHSALLALELYNKNNKDLHEVRKKCVFTTHTPVPAGHDQFPREMAEEFISHLIQDDLKDDLFFNDSLNMTHLGLMFSRYVNGVAKKHGEVSRSMFPKYHIESITNGVHSTFWTSRPFRNLFDNKIPGWRDDPFSLRYIFSVSLRDIWNAHQIAKQELVDYINEFYTKGMNKKTFTIGFARRATAYKRGDMLFENKERLAKIAEKFGGLQIVFGGKAHPKDCGGKEIISKIINDLRELQDNVNGCYLPDYDMGLAKKIIPGVDLWLNTPMRPREASGTSGMKAAHNGVPQFSILDGWWLEGHIENITGWSIGSHPEKNPAANHQEEVEDMYDKLEYVILPMFHEKRERWIEVMRNAIGINGSYFNTHRMVQQYVLNAYFS